MWPDFFGPNSGSCSQLLGDTVLLPSSFHPVMYRTVFIYWSLKETLEIIWGVEKDVPRERILFGFGVFLFVFRGDGFAFSQKDNIIGLEGKSIQLISFGLPTEQRFGYSLKTD